MNHLVSPIRRSALVATLIALIAGCGDHKSASETPPPGGNNPPPETIQGIATPSSVAVVTATNAD